MNCAVVGATGATGREVVKQLVESAECASVTTIGRRALDIPAHPKLVQQVVDMGSLESKQMPQGVEVVFCCLGTTRGVAGSADAFRKVDLDYVEKTASAAKEAGARHFSLVTAQGANANVWANDLKIFHGLLYTKVKGLAEQACINKGFERTSIIRPGLLSRGELARPMEAFFCKLVKSHQCSDIARSMIQDALRKDAQPGLSIFSAASLFKSAQTQQAPVPDA